MNVLTPLTGDKKTRRLVIQHTPLSPTLHCCRHDQARRVSGHQIPLSNQFPQ